MANGIAAAGWSAADKWTLTIAVLALAVSVLAAVVARSQYQLERNAAGGRGISFVLRRPWHIVNNGVHSTKFAINVELFGPGVRHEVALHLERDGRQLDGLEGGYVKPLETRKSMSCDSPEIEWEFELRDDDSRGLWCVLSWVEPDGDALWTHAYARSLQNPDELYEWRYHRTRRCRVRLQEMHLRARPIGQWQPANTRTIHDGQGPIDLGKPPRL